MEVVVEVKLTRKPQKKHWEVMHQAAEYLTNDKESINVFQSPKDPTMLIAEFTMKNAPQIRVVDSISDEFTDDMEDYSDSSIYFPKSTKKRKKKKKAGSKKIPDDIKKQVVKIIERFNKKTIKDPELFYVPRYRGKYLYLDRNEYGDVVPICRLEFNGEIDNWEFAVYKYSDGRYDPEEFMFPGMEFVDGTVIGAMKAGLEAYS